MSIIDQGLEIHKHITLERGMDATIHPIHPFTNLDYCNKITHKHMLHNYANLMKERIVFNSGIIVVNPMNVLTSINKHKLDLAKAIVGTFNVIFMRKVHYSNNTCLMKLIMDIQLVLRFHNVLLPFVSIIFINLVIPNVYWDYG